MTDSKRAAHLVVRIDRIMSAPPHDVYRAWLDPDTVSQWMVPGSLGVRKAEIDERVGGRYRIWQTDGGADAGGFECELVELVPDQKLVFKWGFVGPDRKRRAALDSVLTVTLQSAPNECTALTLVHERLDALADAMPYIAENVGQGWKLALEKLGDLLSRPRSA